MKKEIEKKNEIFERKIFFNKKKKMMYERKLQNF